MAARTPSRDHLSWPFFASEHRAFAAKLDEAANAGVLDGIDHRDADNACCALVNKLGNAGLLRACVPAAYGGLADPLDSRLVCLARETLAYHDGLADFALAMQGLGSGAIGLSGSESLKSQILPRIASGDLIAAFALSEKEAGSDVAALRCSARADGGFYVLSGEKTWISNGGIAGVYTVFARTDEAPGTRGISAFVVFADDPGFSIAERIDTMAPHPLATIRFTETRIPAARRLGAPGEGFKIAMRTLDIFRASV
ncbi:MAG: acyl-CoA dehydrogenase family protein, partial [Hyphomicrobiaceae bacterium]